MMHKLGTLMGGDRESEEKKRKGGGKGGILMPDGNRNCVIALPLTFRSLSPD